MNHSRQPIRTVDVYVVDLKNGLLRCMLGKAFCTYSMERRGVIFTRGHSSWKISVLLSKVTGQLGFGLAAPKASGQSGWLIFRDQWTNGCPFGVPLTRPEMDENSEFGELAIHLHYFDRRVQAPRLTGYWWLELATFPHRELARTLSPASLPEAISPTLGREGMSTRRTQATNGFQKDRKWCRGKQCVLQDG